MPALPAFPLLAKELRELAARPRTYVTRAVLASALLAAFLVTLGTLRASADAVSGLLGRGGDLLQPLIEGLAIAALVVAPASGAMAVASERERGSLITLLLTPMSPWELLLQKWLSRQIGLLALIALAMPLFAVCYAFGGVEPELVAVDAYILLLVTAQLTAIGVAVGAWCRTASGAVVLANVATIAIYAACPVAYDLLSYHGSSGMYGREVVPSFNPLPWLGVTAGDRGGDTALWLGRLVWLTSPAIVSVPLLLMAARRGVVRGLEGRGGGLLLRCFLALDRWFARAELRFGRRAPRELPADAPVAWREINRRALANPRYLVRLGLPLLVAVLICCIVVSADWNRISLSAYGTLYVAVLGLGALAMLALALPLVEGERSRQTLDVLLTTPLRGREILEQKHRALRRLHLLIAGLPLVVAGWSAFVTDTWRNRPEPVVVECGMALLLPAAAAWIGSAAGLIAHGRGRTRAGIVAAILVGAWLGLPLLVEPIALGLGFRVGHDDMNRPWYDASREHALPLVIGEPIRALSPVGLLDHAFNGDHVGWYGQIEDSPAWGTVVGAGLGAQALAWLAARAFCLLSADRVLRRGAADA